MSTYDPRDESKTEILLDKIDALRILRAESDEERDVVLVVDDERSKGI